MQMGNARFTCRADALGTSVCLGGATWSVKGSQGTELALLLGSLTKNVKCETVYYLQQKPYV